MEKLEIIQYIFAIVAAVCYEHTRKPACSLLRWMAPEGCRLEACQKNICAVGRQNLRVRGTANFGRRTYAVRLQDRHQRNDLKVTTPGNRYSVRAVWLHL